MAEYRKFKQCIQKILSKTWNINDIKQEIYVSRKYLQLFNPHSVVLSCEPLCENNFVAFIFNVIIEESVRWTVKKEILLFLMKCFDQFNENQKNVISDSLPVWYLYKLMDVIKIFADYDFQIILIMAIFKIMMSKIDDENITRMIPESKNLQNLFKEINLISLKKTARSFLNTLNGDIKRLFSLHYETIEFGSYADYSKEETDLNSIHFNTKDNVISWYMDINVFDPEYKQTEECNSCTNLIYFCESDVYKIIVNRISCKSYEILFKLAKPCLSFDQKYQYQINHVNTLKIKIRNSSNSENLVDMILPAMFKQKYRYKKQRKTMSLSSYIAKKSFRPSQSSSGSDLSELRQQHNSLKSQSEVSNLLGIQKQTDSLHGKESSHLHCLQEPLVSNNRKVNQFSELPGLNNNKNDNVVSEYFKICSSKNPPNCEFSVNLTESNSSVVPPKMKRFKNFSSVEEDGLTIPKKNSKPSTNQSGSSEMPENINTNNILKKRYVLSDKKNTEVQSKNHRRRNNVVYFEQSCADLNLRRFSTENSSEVNDAPPLTCWTTKAILGAKTVTLRSIDFLGKYLLIIFYNFDICVTQPEYSPEFTEFSNNRLIFKKAFNTDIIFCCKAQHMYQIRNELKERGINKKYKNPVVVDRNNTFSENFFYTNSDEMLKSVVIVDTKGSVIYTKHISYLQTIKALSYLSQIRNIQLGLRGPINLC